MPFFLIIAVLVGAGGLITAAVAAPSIDVKHCLDSVSGSVGGGKMMLTPVPSGTPSIAEEPEPEGSA
jgi:hypothetical protein